MKATVYAGKNCIWSTQGARSLCHAHQEAWCIRLHGERMVFHTVGSRQHLLSPFSPVLSVYTAGFSKLIPLFTLHLLSTC